VFAVIAGVKMLYIVRNDLESNIRSLFLLGSVSMLYDTGILIRFITGYNTAVSALCKDAVCILLGLIVAWVVSRLIFSKKISSADPKLLVCISTGLILLTCGAICAAAVCRLLSDRGDGSVDIRGVSIQLPEILKTELVLSAALTSIAMRSKRLYIFNFYGSSAAVLFILAFVFKEYGTTLLIIYFTLAVSVLLTSARDSRPAPPTNSSDIFGKIDNFLCSSSMPTLFTVLFFIITGIVKRILYIRFPLRGSAGEEVYGLNNSAFNLSSRLSADSSQIEYARGVFSGSWPVQLNFNSSVRIPHAELETSLADYSFAVSGSVLGRYIALLILLVFSVSLLRIILSQREHMLARAAGAMLLLQMFVHCSGILLCFCYTGVNLPFLSVGGSSLVSSVIIASLILISRRKCYEDD
ncbi:MAG: FtsW/RodA/SpoVE family cell cycle protein, partial [Ruminococcus sp.]|nr:FtsW/RodA/SpoVE family cell cycle protein [Ruminococcus sp.]